VRISGAELHNKEGMTLTRPRIRHPLYPALTPVPATEATGLCPAIAGTFRELAEARAAGARASHVVFPMQDSGGPGLTAAERDTLWELFQVPAYVLLLDHGCRVVAYECEAHDGMHLTDNLQGHAVAGSIESSPCDCGRPGLRLIIA
jgi:hypothetical protein